MRFETMLMQEKISDNLRCVSHAFWVYFTLYLSLWSWSGGLWAVSPSPEELLSESRRGRVEMIKAVSDFTAIVPTIPTKEELFPYLVILDDLSLLETDYGLESMGQSVVKILGFAVTNASTKWLRLDSDKVEYVEAFMKYADNNVRNNFAEQQDQYLINDPPLEVTLNWIDKSAWAIALANAVRADFFVVLSFEDFQASVVKRAFRDISRLTDENIELIISKVSAIAALNEVDAYMNSLAAQADSVPKVLRSLRFACIFDKSIKSNPRSSVTLQNAAANSINDALQRLINLRGAVPEDEINKAIQILPPPVVANISNLLVSLSDRLVYRDQVDFLLNLARGLSARLGDLGMGQQQVAIDAFASRLQIMKRVYFKNFEGTYGVRFDKLGGGTLTILHTGGGRIAATMSFRDRRSGLEVPYSLFYFEYDGNRALFQSTRFPFDNTEGQLPADNIADLYFQLEENSNCIFGSFGAPMGQDLFRACKEELVTSFDREVPGQPLADVTSLWSGTCAGHDIQLRISQVGRRVVGNWMDRDAWIAVPFAYGVINPMARSVTLTSGQLDVGRFAQARVLFSSEQQIEVEYILAGRGVACHTVFNRLAI